MQSSLKKSVNGHIILFTATKLGNNRTCTVRLCGPAVRTSAGAVRTHKVLLKSSAYTHLLNFPLKLKISILN